MKESFGRKLKKGLHAAVAVGALLTGVGATDRPAEARAKPEVSPIEAQVKLENQANKPTDVKETIRVARHDQVFTRKKSVNLRDKHATQEIGKLQEAAKKSLSLRKVVPLPAWGTSFNFDTLNDVKSAYGNQETVSIHKDPKVTGDTVPKRTSAYSPGGHGIQGKWETSRPGPDGDTTPHTLEAYLANPDACQYVTLATGRKADYGKKFLMTIKFYDEKTKAYVTKHNIPAVVHDWCPGCSGDGHFDVAFNDGRRSGARQEALNYGKPHVKLTPVSDFSHDVTVSFAMPTND